MSSVFYAFVTLVIFFSVSVINHKNPIYAVFSLIFVFFNTSVLLLMLEVNYLALTMILVYVGAVAILFLFVVFSVNIKKIAKEIIPHQNGNINYSIMILLIFVGFFNFINAYSTNFVSFQFYSAKVISEIKRSPIGERDFDFFFFSNLKAFISKPTKITIDQNWIISINEETLNAKLSRCAYWTTEITDVNCNWMKMQQFREQIDPEYWSPYFKTTTAKLFLCVTNDVDIFGFLVYTHFYYLFLMSGWILTVAMVCSIALALGSKKT